MKTTKPFSTISYNTTDFLKRKLDDLKNRRIIYFYAFIEHFPEEDEKKKHKHLIIFPNGRVDTDSITDFLIEIDPNNAKPLEIHMWKSSKFDDWYLYGIHDTDYLASKGQARKHHYTKDEVICSNDDILCDMIHQIDFSKYKKTKEFVDNIKNGVSFREMVEKGMVPAPMFNQYHNLANFVKIDSTYRNGKKTHTPNEEEVEVDTESGVVEISGKKYEQLRIISELEGD